MEDTYKEMYMLTKRKADDYEKLLKVAFIELNRFRREIIVARTLAILFIAATLASILLGVR